jgi:CMP-N,N'-diacetyllegionaminic acid synthase
LRSIAIIPARGGSKGIPGKNIIDLCGKPLIAWTIDHAVQTPELDAVYVSSDSDEILSVAKQYGAIPIKRPSDIAGDTAPSESAIQHALSVIPGPVGLAVMLQPTSPLRKPDDLSRAIRQFRDHGWDSAFSGAELDDFLIWERDGEGKLKSFNYDFRKRGRRQDRKPQYVENGSFYLFKPQIIAAGNRLGGNIGVSIMEFWQTFEIDTPADLELVRMLFEAKVKPLMTTS